MGCSSMIAGVLLLSVLLPSAGFMMPGAPLAKSVGSPTTLSQFTTSTGNDLLLSASELPCSKRLHEPGRLSEKRRRRGPLLAGGEGAENGDDSTRQSSLSEPILFAQEVLDRAWRSKRRIAAQGKSMPLGHRFLAAFGARTAVFVEDRDFMEETLDNVVRVRVDKGWMGRNVDVPGTSSSSMIGTLRSSASFNLQHQDAYIRLRSNVWPRAWLEATAVEHLPGYDHPLQRCGLLCGVLCIRVLHVLGAVVPVARCYHLRPPRFYVRTCTARYQVYLYSWCRKQIATATSSVLLYLMYHERFGPPPFPAGRCAQSWTPSCCSPSSPPERL